MTVIKPRSCAAVAFKIHIFFKNFYWSIVALQYFPTYNSFYCTAKCIGYMYTYIPLLGFSSYLGHHRN